MAGLPGKLPDPHQHRAGVRLVGGRRFGPARPRRWQDLEQLLEAASRPWRSRPTTAWNIFLAFQRHTNWTWIKLAGDWSVTNKPAALLNLRTNKFASLFTNSVYLDDRVRFETAAAKITDDQTLALREAYWTALVSATTNLNPKLCNYGRATLALATRSAEISRRLERVDRTASQPGRISGTGH